jgi:HEPN domain-containing protein
MPRKGVAPGSPADWLRHAKSDLALARAKKISKDILLEGLCFHAQQAVEKSIKAVLVASGRVVPKTHNIRMLLDILTKHADLPVFLETAAGLTDYAVNARYPGEVEPVSSAEYRHAVALARDAVAWAREYIRTVL